MAETKTVHINGEPVTVGKLSVWKAIRVGKIVSEVMSEIPNLSEDLSEFSRDYASKNVVRISRAAAELRFDPEELKRVSEEAWQANGGELVLPGSPSPADLIAFAFPRVFSHAHEKVLELLAILVAPNSELRTADENGTIETTIESKKKALAYADAEVLVDLLGLAADVIEEQFSGKLATLRKAAAVIGLRPEEPKPTTEEGTTPKTSTPSTSIGSPEPSPDGPEERSSSPSPSPTPSVSSPA